MRHRKEREDVEKERRDIECKWCIIHVMEKDENPRGMDPSNSKNAWVCNGQVEDYK